MIKMGVLSWARTVNACREYVAQIAFSEVLADFYLWEKTAVLRFRNGNKYTFTFDERGISSVEHDGNSSCEASFDGRKLNFRGRNYSIRTVRVGSSDILGVYEEGTLFSCVSYRHSADWYDNFSFYYDKDSISDWDVMAVILLLCKGIITRRKISILDYIGGLASGRNREGNRMYWSLVREYEKQNPRIPGK